MRKLTLLLSMLFALVAVSKSQVASTALPVDTLPPPPPVWTIGGTTSLAFNQVSLTNWAAGGKNSVAGSFLLKSYFNYKKGKALWDNTFDLGYGLTQQGTDNAVKTEDKLQFSSKYGYSASKYWYYSGLVNFKTQMDDGFKDPPTDSVKISTFMAPAYLTLSLGMDFKRSDNFSLYLSPLTTKMTMVYNDELSLAGAYGVEPGENLRTEYGAFVKMVAQKKGLLTNVDFFTRVDLFSNLGDTPQNIDVDWETLFMMRVNKYLTAMVSATVLYDDDTKLVDKNNVAHGARTQIKQLFGLGITYKYGR